MISADKEVEEGSPGEEIKYKKRQEQMLSVLWKIGYFPKKCPDL